MQPATERWLLDFTGPVDGPLGDGRPWGDGTAMAARARAGAKPWDTGCRVTTFVGGSATLNSIRDTFERAIAEANRLHDGGRGKPFGQVGRVYIADWLLNPLRDLSTANDWGTSPWTKKQTATVDQTVLGLIVRMMSAGIVVRVMLWMPTELQSIGGYAKHFNEHFDFATAIRHHDAALQKLHPIGTAYGLVALDMRVAAAMASSLHQKEIVVRVGTLNVAYCGGVDLAYTRRDVRLDDPHEPIGAGDWQSGSTIPDSSQGWPHTKIPPAGGYPKFPNKHSGNRFQEDLPENVYGARRRWFDIHLLLEGPIVDTLEDQFRERWIDAAHTEAFHFPPAYAASENWVLFSDTMAYDKHGIVNLPKPDGAAPVSDAIVQMWRTIPMRSFRVSHKKSPFMRGEFTVMAGIAKAVGAATELITIWDQYFWSEAFARLLARRVQETSLRAIIVLPPFGSNSSDTELWYRSRALRTLWDTLASEPARARVHVFNLWHKKENTGIYCHAKVQTYDDKLVVCGSANLNRRSFENDAELDCAVLHEPTVRKLLSDLHRIEWPPSSDWTDWATGWGERFANDILKGAGDGISFLIPDPFFGPPLNRVPTTPNNVPMTSGGGHVPEPSYEPTSFAHPLEGKWCASSPVHDKAYELGSISSLIERCDENGTWPWRQPA